MHMRLFAIAKTYTAKSDAYFHGASFDEIVAFTHRGGGTACGTSAATGNSAPPSRAEAKFHDPGAHALHADRLGDRPECDA